MSDTEGQPPVQEQAAGAPAAALPDDVETLKALFIRAGGNPNTLTAQKGEMMARDKGRAEVRRRRQESTNERGAIRAGVARFVTASVEVVAVAFTVIIVLGGLTIATFLLLVADIAAVADGFETITTDNAMLYAVATVLFFIVVSFIYEVIALKSVIEAERVVSMRHFWRWLKYFLGWGRNWQEQYRANAPLVKLVGSAVRWLMWTIVLFGLLGRLAEKMRDATDAWHAALVRIATQSTLAEMGGYVGAVVMTVALLLAIRFVVYFVHQIFNRVTGGIDAASFFDDFSPDAIIEGEVITYWKAEVLRLQQRQQVKLLEAQAKTAAVETPEPSQNGSEQAAKTSGG